MVNTLLVCSFTCISWSWVVLLCLVVGLRLIGLIALYVILCGLLYMMWSFSVIALIIAGLF